MHAIQAQEARSSATIILEPTGMKLGATGISSAYDDRYPPELEGWMAREEWSDCIGRINSALMDRFPCGMCRLQTYCCCPCTLGLSLLSMLRQAKEIERGVGEVIASVNRNLETRRRNVRFGFRRKCCRAWVQVEYGAAVASWPSPSKLPPVLQAGAAGMAARGEPSSSSNYRGGEAHKCDGRDDEFQDRKRAGDERAAAVVTVAAMSGATQPFDEEPTLASGRGGRAAAVPGLREELVSAEVQR
ncbi:unnamed protein product [Scytosiphon promiscuus]